MRSFPIHHPGGRLAMTLLAIGLTAPGLHAAQPVRPRNTVARPIATAAGCLNTGAGAIHAAYVPASAPVRADCSQFLSTDTLLTVRRWART